MMIQRYRILADKHLQQKADKLESLVEEAYWEGYYISSPEWEETSTFEKLKQIKGE